MERQLAMVSKSSALSLILLTVYFRTKAFPVVIAQLTTEKFIAVKSSDNVSLCAVSTPSVVTSTRSQLDCIRVCQGPSLQQCDGVNYVQTTSECSVFYDRPLVYTTNLTNCRHYRRSSHDPCYNRKPAPYPLIDASTCSFPYTMNGQLYNKCSTNSSVSHLYSCQRYYCYMINRTIGNCRPPADYVANVINYEVNLTGQPNTVTFSVFGWIAFMWRRAGPGDGNWALPWLNYTNGFGFTAGYLWLGLERVHQLTANGNWRLRLEYYYNSAWVSAEYWSFTVGDNKTNYVINFDGYSGDDNDLLHGQSGYGDTNGMQFSTMDQDNDRSTSNCAYGGGWWFSVCGYFYLTAYGPSVYTSPTTWFPVAEVHVMMKNR